MAVDNISRKLARNIKYTQLSTNTPADNQILSFNNESLVWIAKPSSSVSDIDDAVNKKHTHSNKSLLDDYTGASSGAATFTQPNSSPISLNSGDSVIITHPAVTNQQYLVDIKEEILGSSGVTNVSLDFDVADESNFTQQDAINGTDFTSGLVQLHKTTGGTDTSLAFGTATASAYTQEDGTDGTAFTANSLTLKGTGGGATTYSATDSIPTMTSNTNGSIVLSVSTYEGASYDIWKAFDNTTGFFGSDIHVPSEMWFKVDYGSAIRIGKFTLQNTTDSGSNMRRMKNFVISGSTNNSTWVTCYNGLGENVSTVQTFSWSQATAYRYYKLTVTDSFQVDTGATVNTAGAIQINEMQLFEDTTAAITYSTTGYYVKTNTNQINTSAKNGISSLTVTQTIPANTQILYLVSVDGGTNFKAWNSSSWETVTLANIHTSGMSKTTIEAITQVQWASLFSAGTLDIAVGLKTTDSSVSPAISQITINFADSYAISQAYYVTTTDVNQLEVLSVDKINSLTITKTEPANTTVKWLVSFDGRITWKYWSGSAWATAENGLADLESLGNNTSTFQNGFTNLSINHTTMSLLDFAFSLKSTDNTVSSSVDLISVNYDEESTWGAVKIGKWSDTTGVDYVYRNLTPTQTTVKKIDDGSNRVFINIITF